MYLIYRPDFLDDQSRNSAQLEIYGNLQVKDNQIKQGLFYEQI